jgi:ABC-2 type transport system ATP-binding protein
MSFANASQTPPPDALAIRCRGLHKRFGETVAVKALDLDVRQGECLGLLGPNGAGKTTTIEILEGLQERDGGEVEILGMAWEREPQRIRERLGVQLQESEFPTALPRKRSCASSAPSIRRGRRWTS